MAESGKIPDLTALMANRLRCPHCKRRFRSQDIATIESGRRISVYRLRCPICTVNRLVIALSYKNGVRTFATDLDAEEWLHYRHAAPINADDVLRIVRMLQEYEGDFTDVLEDPLFNDSEG